MSNQIQKMSSLCPKRALHLHVLYRPYTPYLECSTRLLHELEKNNGSELMFSGRRLFLQFPTDSSEIYWCRMTVKFAATPLDEIPEIEPDCTTQSIDNGGRRRAEVAHRYRCQPGTLNNILVVKQDTCSSDISSCFIDYQTITIVIRHISNNMINQMVTVLSDGARQAEHHQIKSCPFELTPSIT